MFSPPLLFFIIAVVGSLLGLAFDLPLSYGALAFCALVVATLVFRSRALRSVLVCCGLATFVATVASRERQQFDTALQSLSYEDKIYEGQLLDLSESFDAEKIGLLKIDKKTVVVLKLVGPAAAQNIEIGDTVRLKGKLSKAHHALSPGQMDGYWFGLSRGVQGRISVYDPKSIAVMDSGESKGIVASVKQTLRKHLTTNLTPREAGLLLALIVGDINLFDDEQRLQYRNIGAGHLLAVSGLQVSILSLIFYRLFLFLFLLIPWVAKRSLARYPAFFLTLLCIWSFILLCGAPPSAVRAGLMTTLMLLASFYAWPTTSMDIFGASGLIILLIHPSAVTDPSFWLSYAAVFGLIVAAQSLKLSTGDLLLLNLDRSVSGFQGKVKALLVSSLGAGLLTLAFSAYYFAEVSLSGLLVNSFLVPVAGFLQTPAILLAALGVLFNFAWLSHSAAFFAGVLDSMCMTLNEAIGHTFMVCILSLPQLALLILAVIFLIATANKCRRVAKLTLAAVCLFGAFFQTFLPRENHFLATFLPVGQGDATVLVIPPGKVMVVDGGGNYENVFNPGERVITPFLHRNGIEVIDVIVLSHPDADHLLGLLPLFEKFQVRELWHNGFDDSHPLMAKLIETSRRHGVKLRARTEMPQSLRFGDAKIEFISLPRHASLDRELVTTNNRSLVMKLSYEGASLLLPGDIEEAAEKALMGTNQDLTATVVKAPHHGSKGASSQGFVWATKASHVVFCTGINNRFGFPHAQAIERWQETGASLWDTAVNGETTFRFHDGIVQVEPFLVTSKEIS